MKNIGISLLAALIIATPAQALSWKDKLFTKLDADQSGEISYAELIDSGCKAELKFFKYADKDRSKGLSRAEYFENRDLLGRCK